MDELSVPGLAVAVVRDGALFGSFASGVTPDGRPMTTSTLTQVGSVSKTVAAVGAIRMAADGKLSWDDDITPSLISYTLPPGAQSGDHPVTLAGLLSHTAGTNVHGFPGYPSATQAPTLPEVLAGQGNTEAVHVVTEPGTQFDYSGGGYELVEQAMLDVSGANDFDTLIRELVFEPAGMVDSRYLLDLPADVAVRATPGSTNGEQLPQRWQAYPRRGSRIVDHGGRPRPLSCRPHGLDVRRRRNLAPNRVDSTNGHGGPARRHRRAGRSRAVRTCRA